jgi:hypothetical protein
LCEVRSPIVLAANRSDRTIIQCLVALPHFVRRHGLTGDKGMGRAIVPGKESRGMVTALVAVDALVADKEGTGGVLGITMDGLGHESEIRNPPGGSFIVAGIRAAAAGESFPMSDRDRIEREMLRLAEARGAGSFCPSEVARACAAGREEADWRELMPLVREVAADLAESGSIKATQGGRVVDVREAKGPLRLRQP